MEKYFGRTPFIKILDFFLDSKERNNRMILNNIAQKTGLHSYSVSRFLKKLVEYEIINEESVGKRTKIYWLNQKNSIVQVLLLLKDIISAVEQDETLIQKIREFLYRKLSKSTYFVLNSQ